MEYRKIIYFLLLLPAVCFARDYNFTWQPNIDPDLAGYRLYRSTTSGSGYQQILEIPCGSNDATCAKCTDYGVDPNIIYYYVATAFDNEGFESDYSNEANTTQASSEILSPTELTIKIRE